MMRTTTGLRRELVASSLRPIHGTGSTQRANGSYFLKLGTTVFDDNQNDSVAGGLGNNWVI